jgi:hypothetical protein
MKGVILGICPSAIIVDVTHGIRPGNILDGAFALAAAVPYFPRGTIHVAVVDPGVGGDRAGLAVRTAGAVFVGPDNGLLDLALRDQRRIQVRRLENSGFWLDSVSRTFHGRDIFAPVAAHLARGVSLNSLGPGCSRRERLTWPEPERWADRYIGQVIALDQFGNAITNLPAAWFHKLPPDALRVRAGRRGGMPFVSHYQALPHGTPLTLIGSAGYLEVAVNGDSAVRRLGLRQGSPVVVRVIREQ